MILVLTNPIKIDRKSRSELIVSFKDYTRNYNLRDITGVVILGSSTLIPSGVVSLLSSMNIPLIISNKLGVAISSPTLVVMLSEVREKQYKLTDEEKSEIARNFILARFNGLSNLLKYYKQDPPQLVDNNDLLVWEAINSRAFWDKIFNLFPKEVRDIGRKPRHSDPFNKSLSLAYALLYAICTRALLSFGFDPTYGFMHKSRYSTALSFDFSEMFKPIAIHAVIRAYKKGLSLDKEGELSKDSVNKVSREFFDLISKKQNNESIYKAVYNRALKLSQYLRKKDKSIKYTFTYDPRKLS
jgi:CRISPR-associated protein Cas1